MLTACERRLIAFYLANAASRLHHQDREAAELAGWIADRDNLMAFGDREATTPPAPPGPGPRRGNVQGEAAPPRGGPPRGIRAGAAGAPRPNRAAAAGARRDRGSQPHRPRRPGAPASLPHPADHRVDGRRHLRPGYPVHYPLQPQGTRTAVPPRRVGPRHPGPFAGRCAARALGARHRGQRRRPERGRSAEPARHRAGRRTPGREPPAVPGRVLERARVVGLRPRRPATATMSQMC